MIMAPPTSQIILFLVSLLLCLSLHLSDPKASSTSPSLTTGQHRHQHQRHHYHNNQLAAASERDTPRKTAGAADSILEVDQRQKDGEEEQEVGDEGRRHQQKARKTVPVGNVNISKSPGSTTTQSAVSLGGVSTEAHAVYEPQGEESPHRPERPGVTTKQSEHKRQGEGHEDGRPTSPFLSIVTPSSSPRPSTVSTPTTTARSGSQQINVPDRHKHRMAAAEVEDTATEQNVKDSSPRVQEDTDDDDVKDVGVPPDTALLETSVESSSEKLVNRPRWRYTLKNQEENKGGDHKNNHKLSKDKSSRQQPKNNKHIPSEHRADPHPDPDHQPKLLPGLPTSSAPAPRRWAHNKAHNRPSWDVSRNADEDIDRSNHTTTEKPKEKNLNGDVNTQKVNKKQKQKSAEEPKKQKKKWRSKQKSKQITKGCPGCTEADVKLAEARELHKQVLKAQLLDKLRLVPTFQKQPWPPKLPDQVFHDVAQQDEGSDEDRYYARPTQLLLLGRDLGPRHRLKKAATGSYQFGVRGKVKGEVRSARLWVYKMKDANDQHEQTLVITELQKTKRGRLRERSLVARLDTHVQAGWVSFDVTHLVRRWVKNENPASLQLLAIRCKTCHRTNYRAIFGVKSHFRPVLVIRNSRERRRHREQRSACDPSNGCCKFDMTVSFAELGIREILRPTTIEADYCFGTCERPDASYFNHTMVIQHMRFNSHHNNATLRQRLKPCCVPVVLRELSIHYYLNSELDSQVSRVPNFLVDRCGCA